MPKTSHSADSCRLFLDLYDLKHDHSRRLDLSVISFWDHLKSRGVNAACVYWQIMCCFSPVDVNDFLAQIPLKGDHQMIKLRSVQYELPHWMSRMEYVVEFCKFACAVGKFLAENSSFEGSEAILGLAHWMLSEKVTTHFCHNCIGEREQVCPRKYKLLFM